MATLDNRDYTLILDKSGSMMTSDAAGGQTRWKAIQETAFALAAKCEQFDPDGINVYLFSGRFKRYEGVTSEKVRQVFLENDPMGGTNLAGVLQHAFDSYFQRKAAGRTKPSGEVILVVTDGEPDDPKAVMRLIVETTRKMDSDEELSVTFLQIGKDAGATRFLKALDDELPRAGAKFDICDTVTCDDMEEMSLTEVLMSAIED
jgi:uncharacterized protein with von Willebrand factor type A (vWA) domain